MRIATVMIMLLPVRGVTAASQGVTVDVHQADLPVFESRDGAYYRLPSILASHKGALLAACQKRKGGRGDWAESALVLKKGVYEDRAKGGVVYSDDHGKTWRVGGAGFAEQGPINGEVALCETSAGEVYVNYRNCDTRAGSLRRLYSRSRDGCAAFYSEGAQEDLPAHGCNAGLASFRPAGAEKPLLLFTYPLESNRHKLTCYVSRDDGRSWSRTKAISDHGGYSDVAVLPNGMMVVLYEKSRAAGLCLARFSLAQAPPQSESRPGK